MQLWTEIRRLVLTKQKTKRAICQEHHLHWKTLQKILNHAEPPGYRQRQPRAKPKLDRFLPIIHEILEQDKQSPPKQRHTIQRIFDRLRTEQGYEGGISVVGDAVRAWRAGTAEVFMPLSHPAGQAQADFGEATVSLQGKETKVAYFVMSLPFSDAFFCQVFPRECTETFQEGHCRAFEFFGGVPTRISYDNSRIAVAKFVGRRGDTPTQEFLRLESHFLFAHHFCLVRAPNEKGTWRVWWGSPAATSWSRSRRSTIWRSSTSSWLSPVEPIWSGVCGRSTTSKDCWRKSSVRCCRCRSSRSRRRRVESAGGQLAVAGAVRYE